MLAAPSRLVVADLGASRVVCGVFTADRSGKLILEHLTVAGLEGDVSSESLWREGVARALGNVGLSQRLMSQLSVALPGHLALTKFIKSPAVARSKRSKIIAFEAAQNIPYPLEEVVWDHLLIADDGTSLEIMLTAVKAETMLGLCAAVNSVGFSLSDVSPSSLALYNAFRLNYPEIKETTLIVDVGARSTQLLLVENKRFCGRNLPLGGNSVTQTVAEALRIDSAMAERLKIDLLSEEGMQLSNASPARAVHAAAEIFVTKLHAEIVRSMVNLRLQMSSLNPTAIYVTGGGSQFESLLTILQDRMKLPVQRFATLRRVEVSPEVRNSRAQSSSALLAQLVGLASGLVLRKRPTVNLLPPVVRDELAFRRRQPMLIAAAALVVVALIPPLHHFHSMAKAGEDQTAKIESQTLPLRQMSSRHAELIEAIERARKEVADLQGVVDRKTSWLRFFADIQSRLVAIEDVWLESLVVVRDPPAERSQITSNDASFDIRLVLNGRLLDQRNPLSKVSPESYERVKRLIASFGSSEFVATVEREQFDNSQPGILRFTFTLIVRPQILL